MLTTAVKSYLKTTRLYPRLFARRYALSLDGMTPEETRFVQLYAIFVRSSGALVFDIGANLGSRVRSFRKLGCRIVAVEPQRTCVAALKKTFGDGIAVVNAAVSDCIGTAVINLSDSHTVSSLSPEWMKATQATNRFPGVRWDRTEHVPTTRLDDLIDEFGHPEFIKIDVEGHEESALRGLSKPVAALSFEFTPETRESSVACVEHLMAIGPYEFNFSIEDTAVLQRDKWVRKDAVTAILKVQRGDIYARLMA